MAEAKPRKILKIPALDQSGTRLKKAALSCGSPLATNTTNCLIMERYAGSMVGLTSTRRFTKSVKDAATAAA